MNLLAFLLVLVVIIFLCYYYTKYHILVKKTFEEECDKELEGEYCNEIQQNKAVETFMAPSGLPPVLAYRNNLWEV